MQAKSICFFFVPFRIHFSQNNKVRIKILICLIYCYCCFQQCLKTLQLAKIIIWVFLSLISQYEFMKFLQKSILLNSNSCHLYLKRNSFWKSFITQSFVCICHRASIQGKDLLLSYTWRGVCINSSEFTYQALAVFLQLCLEFFRLVSDSLFFTEDFGLTETVIKAYFSFSKLVAWQSISIISAAIAYKVACFKSVVYSGSYSALAQQ